MKNKIRILIIGNQGYVGSVLSNQLNDLLKFETFGLDVGIFSRVLIEKNPDKRLKNKHFVMLEKLKKTISEILMSLYILQLFQTTQWVIVLNN